MQDFSGYKKEQLTIDLAKANVYAIVLIIPIVLVFGLPFYLLWKNNISTDGIKSYLDTLNPILRMLLIVLSIVIGIILHELIHGITWSFFASKGFKSIKFGILWKMLTPYCHCTEPLKVKHYILGAIMPAIILGFIPYIIAIITGNFPLLLFGMFFTMVAVGDFMIINLIRKENVDDYVQDHPSEAGCYIYRKAH
ncbi:MAG: DUF3267 domain-containing protein [Chitinophagales bacterium]|nr:DUF3267 domain-containing protein [Chitinophagales bacterium]